MITKIIYLTNENSIEVNNLEDCKNIQDLQSFLFHKYQGTSLSKEVMEEIEKEVSAFLKSKKIKHKNLTSSLLTGKITFECEESEQL